MKTAVDLKIDTRRPWADQAEEIVKECFDYFQQEKQVPKAAHLALEKICWDFNKGITTLMEMRAASIRLIKKQHNYTKALEGVV